MFRGRVRASFRLVLGFDNPKTKSNPKPGHPLETPIINLIQKFMATRCAKWSYNISLREIRAIVWNHVTTLIPNPNLKINPNPKLNPNLNPNPNPKHYPDPKPKFNPKESD